MPPTIPESDFEAMEDKIDTTNDKKYVYNIKFEVVFKKETKMIPGKISLTKSLMTIKNAKRKNEKIDFLDTNGLHISPDLRGIDPTEIEGRFCMEIGGKEANNLYFACTIQTNIPFSVIKGRTIEEFKRHGIFVKIHRGGFNHGVNWPTIGFFLKHHPGFTDTTTIRDKLMKTIATSWETDSEAFDDAQKKKIIKIIDSDSHLESFDPLSIPFEINQTSITAKSDTGSTIRTNAVVVSVPNQFYKVGIMIMDYLTVSSEKIDNFIPLGYKREDPEAFYDIVQDHAHWIEQARHLVITNVPTHHHFSTVTNHNDNDTLESLLQKIPGVDNVTYIQTQKQVNVSIPANKLRFVSTTIKDILLSETFPYKPHLAKKFNPTGSLGSNKSGISKYSAAMSKYKTTRSPNSSVATSNGESSKQTGYTGRSWGGSYRKVPKEIDLSDTADFPTLPPPPVTITTANAHPQGTINDETFTDTTTFIQQAIDAALKKAYEGHQRELTAMQDRFDSKLEEMKQQHTTTISLETKFDKLLEMLTIGSATTLRESPIRKKGKPNNLEQTTFSQDDTPTRSNSQQILDTYMEVDDDETSTGPLTDPLPTSPPRNLTTDKSEADSRETGWITKEKKGKENHTTNDPNKDF